MLKLLTYHKKALNSFYFKLLLRLAVEKTCSKSTTETLTQYPEYIQRYALVSLLQTHSVYYSSLAIVDFEGAVTYCIKFHTSLVAIV